MAEEPIRGSVDVVSESSHGLPGIVTPARVAWLVLIVVSITIGAMLLVVPPVYVLAAFAAMAGAALMFYYPFLGALAYLVFEYARVSAMYPVLRPLQVGKLLVVGMTAALLIKAVATGRFHFVRDRANQILIAWVAIGFVSIFVALNRTMATDAAVDLAKWVMVYLLIVNLVDNMRKWQWFVWALLLLNLKLSQFQLRSYSFGLSQATNRTRFIHEGVGVGSTSFLSNATDFGAAMAVVVPFALFLVHSARPRWLRFVSLGALVMFCTSIMRTGSRGAALALFAMAAVYWFRSRQKFAIGLVVFATALGFWTLAPPEWKARFESAKEYESDRTASSRIEYWKAGLKMFASNPVIGVGLHNFAPVNAAGGGEYIVPHSIYIEAASELGVPGIAILFALLYIIYVRNRETRALSTGDSYEHQFRRSMALALELSLVGFVTSGAFLTILYYPHIFMILAMSVSLNQIAKQESGAA